MIFSECALNTYGQNCASQCSCNFSNTQLCDKKNGTCYCKEGWQGADCTEDVLECANTTICGSNARCSETNGSYICNCDVGYKKDAFGSCVGKFISFFYTNWKTNNIYNILSYRMHTDSCYLLNFFF